MVHAERDEMTGIMQILEIKHTKSKPPTKKMTPKRKKIFFVRDYLKILNKITARGMGSKKEGIFRDTRKKPDKQLSKYLKI